MASRQRANAMASHYDLQLQSGTKIYRAVPYEVVTNWLQQGRVIAKDRVRPVGTETWTAVEDHGELAVFLPQAVAALPNDAAEALQPVELGIEVHPKRADHDEDVDMVPLIDISLVLLIFFMMTTHVAIGGSRNDVTPTQYATLVSGKEMLWVGVDLGLDQQPTYSIGEGEQAAAPGDERLTMNEVIERIRGKLKTRDPNKP